MTSWMVDGVWPVPKVALTVVNVVAVRRSPAVSSGAPVHRVAGNGVYSTPPDWVPPVSAAVDTT